MKINLSIKKTVWAVFFTVAFFNMQKASAKEVWARFEYINPSAYDMPENSGSYVRHAYLVYDYVFRFYTDVYCTTRATLDGPLTGELSAINYYDEALNYGGTDIYYGSAAAGDSEMYLGTIAQFDLWYDVYNTGWGLQTALGGGYLYPSTTDTIHRVN
jgi:hypothetical protein